MSERDIQRAVDRNRVIYSGQGRRFNDNRPNWVLAALNAFHRLVGRGKKDGHRR